MTKTHISFIQSSIFLKREKIIEYLNKVEHPSLKWKTEEDWAKYYDKRVVSKVYSKEEYVFNMVRKKDDGFIDGNVFSLFCIEDEKESWYGWEAEHEPLGTVKIRAKVKDAYYSIVRPGFYELENSKILEWHGEGRNNLDKKNSSGMDKNIPIKRIVTWARPFSLQAKENEDIEACGLLEKIKSKDGEFYQVVIGYFDTYTTDRGEKEYLKALIG